MKRQTRSPKSTQLWPKPTPAARRVGHMDDATATAPSPCDTSSGAGKLAGVGKLAVVKSMRLRAAPGLQEHHAQKLPHGVEFGLPADQRRRQLHHRVAAVVGAAVQRYVPRPYPLAPGLRVFAPRLCVAQW